jgi:secondary thiamine-phosphate synthase enzyme
MRHHQQQLLVWQLPMKLLPKYNCMEFYQKEISLKPVKRGFHLITSEIENALTEIRNIKIGQLQVFIKHTSASLTINENADATVRTDFESHFNKMVPENMPYYIHTYEGPDDLPAHIKSSLLGSSVQIPITNGKLNLGIWQGIYLCEHRDYGGSRKLVLTAFGK